MQKTGARNTWKGSKGEPVVGSSPKGFEAGSNVSELSYLLGVNVALLGKSRGAPWEVGWCTGLWTDTRPPTHATTGDQGNPGASSPKSQLRP